MSTITIDKNINLSKLHFKNLEELQIALLLLQEEKELSNERFVNNAPEKVVAIEKQKMADKEAEIKLLEERLGKTLKVR